MKKILQFIFSLKRQENHKVITIFGFKIKIKSVNRIKNLQILVESLAAQINSINYKQNLVMDYFLNPSDALPASGALKKRKDENLVLLKEFLRICQKHNIPFWLDYGTLLGCKRHNGFVPWDDDIDVSMCRNDFKCFQKILSEEKQEVFDFVYWEDAGQARLIFAQDTGAFLDIYEYEDCGDFIKSIPCFTISAYNSPISKNILFPLKETNFLGLKVKIPANIENYLRIKYGNYNLLPKHSHIIGGHNGLNEYYSD